ncbi:MAG: hypothetical protein R3362_10985 [Rhodothermales bacterium]|nr:hypothetical protein [Rhodothermales bacterium]
MPLRPPFLLPAVLLIAAVAFALGGALTLAGGFVGMGVGAVLWAMGTQRGVPPLMWFGAAVAAFAFVVMVFEAFLR